MYKIKLNNKRKLTDIQDEFQEYFPHLLIHFYEAARINNISYPPQLIQDQEATLKQCRTSNKEGYLYFDDDLSISQLKEILKNNYDLFIEIFHKVDLVHWSQKPVNNKQKLKEINFEVY